MHIAPAKSAHHLIPAHILSPRRSPRPATHKHKRALGFEPAYKSGPEICLKICQCWAIFGAQNGPQNDPGFRAWLTVKFGRAYLKNSPVQGEPEMSQDGPKMAPDRPKMARDGPKIAPRSTKMALRCSKMIPGWPQMPASFTFPFEWGAL